MLKKFFISFLGSMAGFIVAGGVLMIAFFVMLVAVAAKDGEKKTVTVKEGTVLRIELSGEMVDRYAPQPLLDRIYGENKNTIAVNELVGAISKAANDDDIAGIYLDCKGASAGLAQIQAVMKALNEFKASGKWVYAYSDNYTQGNYFLATVADSIFANPQAMVDIHGLSSTTLYFKNLLDKLGVNVQVVKVGTYKSAVEPYMLTGMSDANREQQQHFLGSMWRTIASEIAKNRKVDTVAVNNWANGFTFTDSAATYVSRHIVDRLVYRHEMNDILAKLTDKKKPHFVDYSDYFDGTISEKNKGAHIAVLYALGDIVDEGTSGISAEKLVPEILKLAENEKIDGLVLRVNSPGGSAFASEQIWEALQQWKKITDKPLYVSMGDYAASGGYYISCGADRIYAEPLTLTGSIGIFGMIPDAHVLLNDKLGVNTATVATNKGSLPDFFNAMSPELAAAMQGYVSRGYETFVSRVAAGRKMSVDSVKAIAEGRVWDGRTALKIGLVDKLGGLDMAIAEMAKEINGKDSKKGYSVKEYPNVKMQWWDELMEINSQFTDRAIDARLGESARYYRALADMKRLAPLQCRMDFIEIK